MTPSLSVQMLGNALLLRDGIPVETISSQKARALFFYVACHPHPVAREQLAALFFGDRPAQQAHSNLRTLLARLKPVADYLTVERHTVALNPAQPCDVDVLRFARGLAEVARESRRAPSAADLLENTLALYRGEFLAGFHLKDALGWEEWLLPERERWLRLAIEAYHQFIEFCLNRGAHKRGIAAAQRLLELDPLREEAYRQLMTLYARDNHRLAALSLYERCRTVLAEEMGIDPSPGTIALHGRILTVELQDAAPIEQRALRPHNLARRLTTFVGRGAEQQRLVEWLTNPDCCLVSVVGAGGMGKSRLALQAAWTLATADTVGGFRHGVYRVPLTGIERGADVILAIAGAVGLELQGKTPPEAQLQSFLSAKELLLVLDNTEQLADVGEIVLSLLRAASGVKILITSRERLNVQPEWVLQVDGLPCPTHHDNVDQSDACQLFLQRTRHLHPDFTLADSDRLPLMRLCHLLAGMPLGLELAATWMSHLSIAELLSELEADLDVLTVSLRDIPERHKSIRAVFEQSWRRLLPREQTLFAHLALFRGGFRRAEAEQVAGATLALLLSLEHKSLLRRDHTGRYDLHELMRQFAQEKLAAIDGNNAACARHARCFTSLVAREAPRLYGRDAGVALDTLQHELENIRAAWHYAVHTSDHAAIGCAMEGIARFHMVRAWYREGAALLKAAAAQIAPRGAENPEMQRLYGQLLAWQGKCLEVVSFDNARQLYQQALSCLESFGESADLALPLTGLGYIAQVHGEYEKSESDLNRALALHRAAGDRYGEAVVLNHLCQTAYRRGMLEQAKALGMTSVAVRRDIEDILGLAASLINLGLVLCQLGEYDTAHNAFSEALSTFKRVNARTGMANALNGLVQVAFVQGDIPQAKTYIRDSLALYREAGDAWGAGLALNNLGFLANEQQLYEEARQALEEAVTLFRHHQISSGLAGALRNLGNTYRDQRLWERAHVCYRESLEVARDSGATSYLLQTIVHYARLLWLEEGAPLSIQLLEFARTLPALRHDDRQKAERWLALQHDDASSELHAAAPPNPPLTLETAVLTLLSLRRSKVL